VQRVTQEKLHDNFASFELGGEAAETGLVFISGRAESELSAEFLGKAAFQPNDGLLADLVFLRKEAVSEPEFVLGEALHADQQATLGTVATRPLFDQAVDCFPTAQVEVADTEVGAMGDLKRVPQSREKFKSYVVKDPRHLSSSSRSLLICLPFLYMDAPIQMPETSKAAGDRLCRRKPALNHNQILPTSAPHWVGSSANVGTVG
jgi:hypothetical protein